MKKTLNEIKEPESTKLLEGGFKGLNTNLLLKRTAEKIEESDIKSLIIPYPSNERIYNLVSSLRELIFSTKSTNSTIQHIE